jgi:hypothetical protein
MKTLPLKTIALALTLAAASAFGAETGAPFEQTQLDRTAPNVPQRVISQPSSGGASGAASRVLASGVWATDHNFVSPSK